MCTCTMKVNYSLYLVTDNTNAILGDRDLCWVVEEAVKGGGLVKHIKRETVPDLGQVLP